MVSYSYKSKHCGLTVAQLILALVSKDVVQVSGLEPPTYVHLPDCHPLWVRSISWGGPRFSRGNQVVVVMCFAGGLVSFSMFLNLCFLLPKKK